MKMTFFFTSTKVGFQLPNIGYVLSLSRNLEGHLDLTWRLSWAINAAYITSENLEKQGDSSSADFARTLSVEKLLKMKL